MPNPTVRWLLSLVAVLAALGGTAAAQDVLYTCDGGASAVDIFGLALCDAETTDTLEARAEPDNLQVRPGALVERVEAGSIAAVAGFQAGDMIYRVGGVDVADVDDAATAFTRIAVTSDTIVNFLRRGRPYRIKLRRPE